MRVPDETLQAIRSRVSIVELVGRYVALKRTGSNWKGLCPFHSEKTPSFTVSEERGSYHCFGCGAGGSAFRFVMEVEGKTFMEAVKDLAERAGVALKLGPENPRDDRAREERERLRDVLELAARYYRHQLVEGRAGAMARAYLDRRQVHAEEAERFRLGCAPAGWDHLARYLHRKGVDLEMAVRAGLVSPRTSGGYYDRLRDRLVFPITDATGGVLSFGGRLLGPGEPKYLNGPETAVFRKGELLYGIHQAADALRRERRALIVEGYLDVISLHARGYVTALATLGTALTTEHVQFLRRRTDEVVTVYDGDEAGRKAAFRSVDLFLAEGFSCRGVLLPPEHDPDSFVRNGGDLKSLVDASRSLLELYVEEVAAGQDLGTVEGKLAAVDAMAPKLAAVTDPLARDLYIKHVTEALGIDETLLRAKVRPRRKSGDAAPATKPTLDPTEKALVECLVHEPQHRSTFRAAGIEAWMHAGALRDAARFVADRSETAGELLLDEASDAVRRMLAEVLVANDRPLSPYALLVAKLKLRTLEERALRVVEELRRAESRDDQAKVDELIREQTEVSRALVDCRRAAAGRGP